VKSLAGNIFRPDSQKRENNSPLDYLSMCSFKLLDDFSKGLAANVRTFYQSITASMLFIQIIKITSQVWIKTADEKGKERKNFQVRRRWPAKKQKK
jgi:hypothetical protein